MQINEKRPVRAHHTVHSGPQ